MPNINRPVFEEGERPEGFRSKRARVGYELGTKLIGFSQWELPPGEAAYPYHCHYSDEELVIVLSGKPTLRTPEGTREIEEGEVLHFPVGEEGAHQLYNQTAEPVTLLAIASSGRPDVIVYPDTDKIGFGERLPKGGGLRAFFRRGDGLDYFEGERPPGD
jgi:uncharacterized cupin superfamily protein